MVQWVKDLALSLQQLRSPLGVWSLALEFLHTMGTAKKKKKKKRKSLKNFSHHIILEFMTKISMSQ